MTAVRVVFEDKSVLVIDKPAGMISNRVETAKKEVTLQDWIENKSYWKVLLRSSFSDQEKYFISRGGLVHRLDKDTSGLMVIAKSYQAFKDLARQFKKREVEKEYLALLHGVIEPKVGTIFLPLARDRSNRKKFAVSVGGKKSLTRWVRIRIYREFSKDTIKFQGYQSFSLVRLIPETGRTHQIRVHLSHINHPLVGDSKYTGRKRAKADNQWCSRQFLHSHKLSFIHPVSKRRKSFKSELAEDLSRAVKSLK